MAAATKCDASPDCKKYFDCVFACPAKNSHEVDGACASACPVPNSPDASTYQTCFKQQLESKSGECSAACK